MPRTYSSHWEMSIEEGSHCGYKKKEEKGKRKAISRYECSGARERNQRYLFYSRAENYRKVVSPTKGTVLIKGADLGTNSPSGEHTPRKKKKNDVYPSLD